VHPDDERYKDLVGKVAVLPLLGREIPVIADSFVDRQFGTGAVKVTPAHDPNDFLAGKRNGLPFILIIDGNARMTAAAGPYAGLDRLEARKRVIEDLNKTGQLVKQERHQYAVGHCDRCKTIVEPLLSVQWFLKMEPLAAPAIQAVEEGRIRFIPENWSKTFFEWMRNIRDWCISRQLWWGHRIPAWYCDSCGEIIVQVETPAGCPRCGKQNLRQETDVLDTWFSSGLWPMSVFGWPDQTPELKYYYPTDLLVTGFDIIFFWVARMSVFGLKFMKEVPFHDVYIHGLVRDEFGQKMSKSKGNTLDPTELIDEYGADALRFTLAVLAVPSPDIPLAPKRIQGYKAFLNKLWNSVRFALMKIGEGENLTPLPEENWDLGDHWITSRFHKTAGEVNEHLKAYRYDLAANSAYQFLWHEFCDWYIEWIKPHLNEDQPDASAKKGLLLQRISDVLRLLHPFVPFVTEYLWQQLPEQSRMSRAVITARYPLQEDRYVNEEVESKFGFLMEIIGKIRQVRTEMNIEPSRRVEVFLKNISDPVFINSQEAQIRLLTRAEKILVVSELPAGLHLARGIVRDCEIAINLTGILDLKAEGDRLRKELNRIETDLAQSQKKLSNENFLRNAPPEIVTEQKAKFEELQRRKEKTEEHIRSLNE